MLDKCSPQYMETLLERFGNKISMPSGLFGCWQWTGKPAGKRQEYAQIRVYPTKQYVHRLSYVLYHGDVPDGLEVDHRVCGNTLCVNPHHLVACPPKENKQRGDSPPAINARKRFCKKRGHLLSGDNLYLDKQGYRHCRACQVIQWKKRRGLTGWDRLCKVMDNKNFAPNEAQGLIRPDFMSTWATTMTAMNEEHYLD